MEKINYEIDWTNAPEWAIAHAFDKDGQGYFLGILPLNYSFCADCKKSIWKINSELLHIHEETWKKSITFRPTINK